MSMLNHNPAYCNITDCKAEADSWIEEPTADNQTFYLCQEHREQIEDEDGFYNIIDTENKSIVGVEIAIYQCNENCEVCT